ncbi:DinB family protein [bacterium]|nr:DinB family protein [bacterium]
MAHPEIDALRLNAVILENFIKTIPEADLHVRRGEGFWTVYEHLHHLALVQPVMFKRLRSFKNEERPVITPYNPFQDTGSKPSVKRPAADLVRSFQEWRDKQLDLILSCDDAVWARTGIHPEYHAYSFEIVVRHILFHDGTHFYRMEELWLAKEAQP